MPTATENHKPASLDDEPNVLDLPDGRKLSYHLYGAAEGPAVVVLDGLGSRGLPQAADAAARRGGHPADRARPPRVRREHASGKAALRRLAGRPCRPAGRARGRPRRHPRAVRRHAVRPGRRRGAARADDRGRVHRRHRAAARARCRGRGGHSGPARREAGAARARGYCARSCAACAGRRARTRRRRRASSRRTSRPWTRRSSPTRRSGLSTSARRARSPNGPRPWCASWGCSRRRGSSTCRPSARPWRSGRGDRDVTHPVAHARRLAGRLADARVTVIPDAGTIGLMPHYGEAVRFAAGLA